jgi:RNA ligase
MFYQFPIIRHIDDVLQAIEGASEFLVADRGDHITINYMVNTPTTFPPVCVPVRVEMHGQVVDGNWSSFEDPDAAMRRECRGIKFSKDDGRIICRPMQKFFNIGQIDETQPHLIDLSHPHDILEKLDGSFICPYKTSGGKFYVGTKMGSTDVADQAEFYMKQNPKYLDFSMDLINKGYTPTFEWCSRKQRIVVDHPEDQLILLAIRNIITGEYLRYD